MFLVVVDVAHPRLEVLSPLLVTELANMSTCLPRLSPISRFDDFSSSSKSTKATLSWHQSRILVREQSPDERCPRVRVFGLSPTGRTGERLGVVPPHAAVAYAIS